MAKSNRLKKEIPMLQESPPPGVQCWQAGDAMDRLEAVIIGPENSPVGHDISV